MLKLEHRLIDYLKLDVEGYEVPTFKSIFENAPHLLNNIKQIGMEIHLGRLAGKLIPWEFQKKIY